MMIKLNLPVDYRNADPLVRAWAYLEYIKNEADFLWQHDPTYPDPGTTLESLDNGIEGLEQALRDLPAMTTEDLLAWKLKATHADGQDQKVGE